MEVEVKLKVAHSNFLEMLDSIGLEYEIAGSYIQEDIYLDFNDCRLLLRDSALRVRLSGGSISITYKGPRRLENGEKIREELEAFIGSAECDDILRRIGIPLKCPHDLMSLLESLRNFSVSERVRVKKVRTELRLKGFRQRIYLDRVEGLGEFVEIEGEGASELVKKLGMVCNIVIPSYAHLVHALRGSNS